MRIVWSLAMAQLRHHRGRWALLAAGIALVVAVPVTAAGLASDVRSESITHTVGDLTPAERALFVSFEGHVPGITSAASDREVRGQFARLGDSPVRREMMFRQLTVRSRQLYLAATDQLAHAVTITSGRLPQSCTPTRCEVVVVGNHDSTALRRAARDLGVVVVGTAARADPLLISGELDIGATPLLVGDGVDAMAKLKTLELFSRVYAWTASVDAKHIVASGVPAFLVQAADVADQLVQHVGQSVFVRPDQQLQANDHRAQVSTRRFALLAGLAAALLLGFAVVAASGLRREAVLLVTLLRRRGATAGQIGSVVSIDAATAGVAGAVLGGALGAGAVALVTAGHGRSIGAAIGHAIEDAGPAAAILTGVAALVVTAVLLWPDAQSRAVWRLLDVVGLASLAAAILATDRGSSNLSGGSDPLVVTLPVLASVTAGLLAARLWAPASRLVARLLPSGSLAGRVGLLGLIRRPLRPAATVAFLTAAVASVVFAGAYRATLLANDADQAAFQVPLDAIVTSGPNGNDATPVVAATHTPGAHVFSVLRVPGAVTRLAGVVDSVSVVGVDSTVLPLVHRWSRATGSSRDPATLARQLRPVATPVTSALPAGTRTIAITASGLDKRVDVSLWLADASGHETLVSLRRDGGRLIGTLAAPSSGPLRAVAVGIAEDSYYASREQHAVGEGTTDQATVNGTLKLGAVTVDGKPAGWDWSSWGAARGTASASATLLALRYDVTGRAMVALADFAASSLGLPIVVDPVTAASARGGSLQVTLDGDATVAARIVAVLPRLPTVDGPFILADRTSLTRALDRAQPGRSPVEYWISGPVAGFPTLTVARRDAVQADLDADPIGRGARVLLVVVALLALGVAAVALVLLVVGERRDGAGELYSWEADGTPPHVLRRMLQVRMAAVAAVSIPVGVASGLILARVGTTLVAVDASGSTPTPPLAVTLGSVWTPLALAVGIGAGLLAGWVAAARSLRERFPVAAEADLR